MQPEDILPLFRALDEEGVEYVLIGGGGHGPAGAREGHPGRGPLHPASGGERPAPPKRVAASLPGWSVEEIVVEDLAGEYPVVRYGPPDVDYLVDILGRLGDVWKYDDLEWERIEMGGTHVRVATPKTLHRMKRDTVRPRDRMDAEVLRQRFGLEEDD